MKPTALVLFILLFQAISYAQDRDTTELIPNWKKGDVKRYEIKNYSKPGDTSQSKQVVMRVEDISNQIYTIRWQVEKLSSPKISGIGPIEGLIASLENDLDVQYTINRDGKILDIVNLEELIADIDSKIESGVSELIKTNVIDEANVDMLRFQLSLMYTSPDQIKLFILGDIYKYHQIYGFMFFEKKETSIQDNIYMPAIEERDMNYLKLKLIRHERNSSIFNIEGFIEFATYNGANDFQEKDITINYAYQFKSPENWLVSFRETRTSKTLPGISGIYEIKLVE